MTLQNSGTWLIASNVAADALIRKSGSSPLSSSKGPVPFRECVRSRLRRWATAPGGSVVSNPELNTPMVLTRDRRRARSREILAGDLAVQRRAGSCVFFPGPVDRGAHVIGGLLPWSGTYLSDLLRDRACHQDAMRGDRIGPSKSFPCSRFCTAGEDTSPLHPARPGYCRGSAPACTRSRRAPAAR